MVFKWTFWGGLSGFHRLSAAAGGWPSGLAGAPKVASAPRGPGPVRFAGNPVQSRPRAACFKFAPKKMGADCYRRTSWLGVFIFSSFSSFEHRDFFSRPPRAGLSLGSPDAKNPGARERRRPLGFSRRTTGESPTTRPKKQKKEWNLRSIHGAHGPQNQLAGKQI